MGLTGPQRSQRVNAGKASAAARRELLGPHVYRLRMQERGAAGGLKAGAKGGRPTWQESLAKAKQQELATKRRR